MRVSLCQTTWQGRARIAVDDDLKRARNAEERLHLQQGAPLGDVAHDAVENGIAVVEDDAGPPVDALAPIASPIVFRWLWTSRASTKPSLFS
jgi:hypothetical protein